MVDLELISLIGNFINGEDFSKGGGFGLSVILMMYIAFKKFVPTKGEFISEFKMVRDEIVDIKKSRENQIKFRETQIKIMEEFREEVRELIKSNTRRLHELCTGIRALSERVSYLEGIQSKKK